MVFENDKHEERVKQVRESQDKIQEQFTRLADEAAQMRTELEEKTEKLFFKDNRLEWMQQRAAELAAMNGIWPSSRD